jgi:hypothetical protein
MRATAIAIGGLMLALLAMQAFAQSGEWERVPSESSPGAASGGSVAANAPAENRGAMACSFVATLVQQMAKLRDQGVTEEAQLASIDKPGGKLYRLTVGGMLSADTAGTLRAGIHREIVYVYEHREMTPTQLGAHARETCGNPESGDKASPGPSGNP